MKHIFKDILLFFKGHWPHLIIAIPAAIIFTVPHELAHCLAVWIQGGTVTDFVWLPSGSEWGHMSYSFPSGVEYSQTLVSLSPYIFWTSFCLIAGLLSLRKTAWHFWIASTIFVWLFIVPFADIANAAIPYLLWNNDNDFQQAFGPSQPSFVLIAIILGIVALIYGFIINKRLYRERALGFPTYCILAISAAFVLFAITA